MISKARQIVARWTRFILGGVLAGILVACSASVHLVSGLNEAEANEVLGLLLGANISATKLSSKTGTGIQVDAGSVAQAIEILRQNGLAKPSKPSASRRRPRCTSIRPTTMPSAQPSPTCCENHRRCKRWW